LGIPGHSVPTMDFYTVTVPANGGKKYLAGYIILSQLSANDGYCAGPGAPDSFYCTSTLDCLQFGIETVCDKTTLQNRFVGWEYLVDLQKGFASGFNAVSIEDGIGQNLGEDGGNAAITAATFWPRIYVHNALSQTWNWWIVLAGRNEYSCGGVAPAPGRYLKGYVCSPEEVCPSFSIRIPKELNIIDMMTEMPQVSSIPGWPKSAFAIANVEETYSQSGKLTTIQGTMNTEVCSEEAQPAYSMFGWSYQRAQSDTPIGGFNGSWDVVHPFHRNYCSGAGEESPAYSYVVGPKCGRD